MLHGEERVSCFMVQGCNAILTGPAHLCLQSALV
jgi:hypothetical protein